MSIRVTSCSYKEWKALGNDFFHLGPALWKAREWASISIAMALALRMEVLLSETNEYGREHEN